MHSFEVHSNESACRKKVRLGMEQVKDGVTERGYGDSGKLHGSNLQSNGVGRSGVF